MAGRLGWGEGRRFKNSGVVDTEDSGGRLTDEAPLEGAIHQGGGGGHHLGGGGSILLQNS